MLKAAAILILPVAISFGGAELMSRLSGRSIVTAQLASLPEADAKPLNRRLRYDVAAVQRHWGALTPDALAAEIRFLEMDLVFPLAYGGAFLAGLLLAWAMLGRPLSPVWMIAVVAVTIVADWTENLTLLPQIRAFAADRDVLLDATRIAVASGATVVKLTGALTLGLGVLGGFAAVVLRSLAGAPR